MCMIDYMGELVVGARVVVAVVLCFPWTWSDYWAAGGTHVRNQLRNLRIDNANQLGDLGRRTNGLVQDPKVW